jgi:hypothetical protein
MERSHVERGKRARANCLRIWSAAASSLGLLTRRLISSTFGVTVKDIFCKRQAPDDACPQTDASYHHIKATGAINQAGEVIEITRTAGVCRRITLGVREGRACHYGQIGDERPNQNTATTSIATTSVRTTSREFSLCPFGGAVIEARPPSHVVTHPNHPLRLCIRHLVNGLVITFQSCE